MLNPADNVKTPVKNNDAIKAAFFVLGNLLIILCPETKPFTNPRMKKMVSDML